MKQAKIFALNSLVLALLLVLSSCGSGGTEATDSHTSTDTQAQTDEQLPDETEESTASQSQEAAPATSSIPMFGDFEIPEGEVIRIGYLTQNETDQFSVFLGQAIRNEAERYGDAVIVEVSDAQGTAATQVSQAENMVAKGMDVVIISAVDKEACAPAVSTVVDAGIPIITLNTMVVNNDLATAYVGVDDEEAGEVAMQLMAEALGGEGTINVILGQLGHPSSEDRWIGVQRVLEQYPDIEVASSQPADWDRAKAMNVTEDWLSSGIAFDGVLALNDEMAISSAHALASANRSDVLVIGVDALDEALNLIEEGKMYGTVFQDADAQGRGALNVAICAHLGLEIEGEYLIPFQPVTVDTARDYFGLLGQ